AVPTPLDTGAHNLPVRTGDHHRRTVHIARAARGGVHPIACYRTEQLWKPRVVVEAEVEKLFRLEKGGDRRVGFERARHRAYQVASRVVQLLLCNTLTDDPDNLLINRRDCAVDVRGTDAGTDHQRSFGDIRVERARDVVGHPLPFADAVAEPAANRVLAEYVVHQPAGVVVRIPASDGHEAAGDVRLRLVHHLHDHPPAGV